MNPIQNLLDALVLIDENAVVTKGVPVALTLIANRPFLSWQIDFLRMQGLSRIVFAISEGGEAVVTYLKENYPTLDYDFVMTKSSVSCGERVRMALQKVQTKTVLIAQGEVFMRTDVPAMLQHHLHSNVECTLTFEPGGEMGTLLTRALVLDAGNETKSYANSKQALHGNCFLLLEKEAFFNRNFSKPFSFQEDYLASLFSEGKLSGWQGSNDMVDIRHLANKPRAEKVFSMPLPDLSEVDKSWTLFIDRDGVINNETIGEYILHWKDFIFSRGVLASFQKLSAVFGRVLLVTNQRGVGKGLMTQQALNDIHEKMQEKIAEAGGHIDKVYFCTSMDNKNFYRKPNPGMAWRAKNDFPEIDFAHSIMVGNKPSDMRFGRAAGMVTVFVATTNPEQPFPHPDIDYRFENLAHFTAALK